MPNTWKPWLATEHPVGLRGDLLFHPREELFERLAFLADHIASAVLRGGQTPSSVFAISGPWGTGKSSALEVILDLVRRGLEDKIDVRSDRAGVSVGDQLLITTSTF